MRLIKNPARAWRLFSVQVAAVAVAFGLLPIDQQTAILSLIGVDPSLLPAVIGIVFIVSRMIAQPGALDNEVVDAENH